MEHWTDRLSDYLDGDLNADERTRLEAHLARCAECAATADQLRAVVSAAGSLTDSPPATDLWQGIAGRIDQRKVTPLVKNVRRAQRNFVRVSAPQLAAAALVLMVASAGLGAFLFSSGSSGAPIVNVTPSDQGVYLASEAEVDYQVAIHELEEALEDGRSRLDTATVRILEENLQAIDQAILEARSALAQDPGNAYLGRYLARTMRTKLSILERGNSMIVSSNL